MFKKIVLALFLVVFFANFNFVNLAQAASPEEAVQDLQMAIDTYNVELFKARLNVPKVLNQAADSFVLAYQNPEFKKQMPEVVAFLYPVLADPKMKMMRTTIMSQAEAMLYDAVLSGALAGQANEYQMGANTMLSPLSGNISKKRKEIFDIQKAVDLKSPNKACQVEFKVQDYENNQIYPVSAILLPNGEKWKIEEISNFPEIFQKMLDYQNS